MIEKDKISECSDEQLGYSVVIPILNDETNIRTFTGKSKSIS